MILLNQDVRFILFSFCVIKFVECINLGLWIKYKIILLGSKDDIAHITKIELLNSLLVKNQESVLNM